MRATRPAISCPNTTAPPRGPAITVAGARHHVRITGQLLSEASAGCGAAFIDPWGDAVAALPRRYP